MKTIIKKSLQSLLFVPLIAFGASAVMPVFQPVEVHAQAPEGGVRGGANATVENPNQAGIFAGNGIFRTIVNTLLYIIGAVSVVMIIYGGFRYVTSAGDSSGVTAAKNTILYAVIGLI